MFYAMHEYSDEIRTFASQWGRDVFIRENNGWVIYTPKDKK